MSGHTPKFPRRDRPHPDSPWETRAERRKRRAKLWSLKWKKRNREKVAAIAKEKYHADLELSRSKVRAAYLKYRNDPRGSMLRSARSRANEKGLPFSITKEDIVVPEVCPVLGIPLKRSESKRPTATSPSLDRIVPELGYVPGNVKVISYRANAIKQDATAEELLAVYNYVVRETA